MLNRINWRSLLFTTPDWEKFISGVIFLEETLFQTTPEGKSMVELMTEKRVVPGIKTGKGLGQLPTGENFTMVIDGLDKSLGLL